MRAPVAAGTNVIAFATPFTAKSLHETKVVEHDRILHESDKLLDMVRHVMEEHERKVHKAKDQRETQAAKPIDKDGGRR